MNKKIKVIILKNELPDDDKPWIKACESEKERVDYELVDLTKDDWLKNIRSKKFDVLLARPGGLTANFKQLYDERIYILERVLGHTIFPTAEEIFIYENKRFFSFWLEANMIPHPKTNVFYTKNESLSFIEQASYPFVAKVSIGASGSGVRILKTEKAAEQYIIEAFEGKGAEQRIGPNLKFNGLIKRIFHYALRPKDIKQKLNRFKALADNVQKGFVIFQEFIPHDFEWRVVRIGDSFFAHKKMIKGEKASGSLLKSYDNPPLELLTFVKKITDKHKMYSQAVDVFEHKGQYLINEMQCIFGQSDKYQMMVDGIIGRYIFKNDNWLFEKGDFNENECYNLRLKTVLDNLGSK